MTTFVPLISHVSTVDCHMSQNDDSQSQVLKDKTLAQVLYELNPAIGWSPAWHALDQHQRRWWTDYEMTARAYILRESEIRDATQCSGQTRS